jgi:hypothetical protein
MTFITRSLPLNRDILLLGVVEPPDWAGKTSGRDLGLEHVSVNCQQVSTIICNYLVMLDPPNVDPGRSGILAVPAPHQNFIFSTLFKLQLNNQNTIKLTN